MSLPDHDWYFVLHAEPDTLEVNRYNAIPIGFRSLTDGCHLAFDAGIVVSNVQATIMGNGLLNHGLDIGGLGNITAKERRVPARLLDEVHGVLAFFHIDVSGNHIRAATSKQLRGRSADPRCCARHQGYLAAKFVCHSFGLWVIVIQGQDNAKHMSRGHVPQAGVRVDRILS